MSAKSLLSALARSPVALARIPVRTAGFSALTFTLLGALEVDTRRSPEAARLAVLQKWMRRYGRGLLGLYGLRPSTAGPHIGPGAAPGWFPGADARGRGRVFVMNHRSSFDILATLAFAEATIVSRADLAEWPVIGTAARRVGTLFVDRSDRKSGSAVVTAMSRALQAGRGVVVYPEGTTFSGDEVRPFKPGAFLAAERADAEVVPLGIAWAGSGVAFGEEEGMAEHYARLASTKATRFALVAGDPLPPPSGPSGVSDLKARAQAAVQSLVHEARALLTE